MESKKKQSRSGKRAPGIVVVTVPMSEALRNQIRNIAEIDQRTLAAWIRFQMQNVVRRSMAARKAAA